MRIRKLGAHLMVFALVAASSQTASNEASAVGYGDTCYQLWRARNGIYHNARYCFKTEAAIREFGNAGCRFDSEYELPLSADDRAVIDLIAVIERQKGC
jgi:YARHG domain